MKLLKLLLKPETFVPVLALIFASGMDVALVTGRIVQTHNIRDAYLIWNLFLGWLPLFFALLAVERAKSGNGRGWVWIWSGLWLLFFPNAPYIFTDLIHLVLDFAGHFWGDLILILCCAVTGLLLGFISLYLMHALVEGCRGIAAGWVFAAAASGLAGLGVFLGRFFRLNSWDALMRTSKLIQDLSTGKPHEVKAYPSAAFPLLFGLFLFITYVALHGMTHLSKPRFHNPGRRAEDQAG